MNRDEALQMLGLGADADEEQIRDAHEQKLFEHKNDLLQKFMVPTLLLKRVKLLEQFVLVEGALAIVEEVAFDFSHDLSGNYHTQTLFLEAYERNGSDLKLYTMNISSFDALLLCAFEFVDLQEVYMAVFKEQFNEYSEALPEEVNTRDMIDTGTLLQGLKAGVLDANMIWNIERELARISKIITLS